MFHDRLTGHLVAKLDARVVSGRFVALVETHAGVEPVPAGARIVGVEQAPTLAPDLIDILGVPDASDAAAHRLDQMADATDGNPAEVLPLVIGISSSVGPLERELLLDRSTPALLDVCRKPTTRLRGHEDIVWLSRAKRLSARGESWIDGHPEQWAGWQRGAPMPHKAPAVLPEVDLDLYENRLTARLIDRRLVPVLRARLRTLDDLARNRDDHFAAARFGHFSLHERLGALWREWILDHDEGFDDRLSTSRSLLHDLLHRVQRLKRTPLMATIAPTATVPSTLRRTNVLRSDARYRRVGELWDLFRRAAQAPLTERIERAGRLASGHDQFVRIVVARALRALGWDAEVEVRRADHGVLELMAPDAATLRIVPILAAMPSPLLATELPRERDTVIVHLGAASDEALGKITRVDDTWFVATSPMDLHVVERVGHVIRTHVLGARLRALPAKVALSDRIADVASLLELEPQTGAAGRPGFILSRALTAVDWQRFDRFSPAARGAERKALDRDLAAAREALAQASARLERAFVCPRPHCDGTGTAVDARDDRYLIKCRQRDCSARWGMQTCGVCRRPIAFFTLQEMAAQISEAAQHGVYGAAEVYGMTAVGDPEPDHDGGLTMRCDCGHPQPVTTLRRV